MGYKNKKSIILQVQELLDQKLAIGSSKYEAKKAGTSHLYIYSWQTYKNYLRNSINFMKWAKETHSCKNIDTARKYVDEYILRFSNAFTQKSYASALAKLYGCRTTDFVKTGTRYRKDIKRSRKQVSMDAHFSREKNQELINFCCCTGLRRHELANLKGTSFVIKNERPEIIVEKGKGGKPRFVPIIGTHEQVTAIIERMSNAGESNVWAKIHDAADIHEYRARYANAMYNQIARKPELIPLKERYCCRKDLKGIWYDRQAMEEVSRALGHNRVSVIAYNYLRTFE